MGVLEGVRVLEFAGIGPGPFCGMLLADMGADVIAVERTGGADTGLARPRKFDVLRRGRRSLAVDLKRPEGLAIVLELVDNADALIEGYRPGVMERLGLGPDVCRSRNPRIVYGRVTGWGQHGPLVQTAGHDINYIAEAGILNSIGINGAPPVVPLNLVGDYGGGGMLLAVGILGGLLEVRTGGQGQVVDAAMMDGAALLSASLWGAVAAGSHDAHTVENVLNGAAPYYGVFECADGAYVAVGAIEQRFWETLLLTLGLEPKDFPDRHNPDLWPPYRERIAAVFRARNCHDWARTFGGIDACVSPVVPLGDAPLQPHAKFRNTFLTVDGVEQPAPAPRFSENPSIPRRPPVPAGADTHDLLLEMGYGAGEYAALLEAGVVAENVTDR